MKYLNYVDRCAILFLSGVVILALIMAQPRRYIWFEDDGTPHESMGPTPPVAALESVVERTAANALHVEGFITISSELNPRGTLQIHIDQRTELYQCLMQGITSADGEIKILHTAAAIISVENFNRPQWMRAVKNSGARLSFALLGRVIPISLGPGQIRMKRFRSLLFSGWKYAAGDMPVDRKAQLEFLLDPCKNAAAVAGLIELEWRRDPNQSVVDVARRYNGNSRMRGGFGYGELVVEAYRLLDQAETS